MTLVVPAFGKLNLTLDVIGRRPDGYHEIASVMMSPRSDEGRGGSRVPASISRIVSS